MKRQKECSLTEEQFNKILKMCRNCNEATGRREKPYLIILLKLLYYCHIPFKDALSLAPCQVNGPNEEVPGWYRSEKNSGNIMVFEIPDFFYKELCAYQRTYRIGEEIPYVGKTDRGVRGEFQKITMELGYGAIQLKEIRKLGLQNYTATREPYKYKEDV